MYCKELNKDFDTKKEMISALKANKTLIIKQKKSDIKTKDNKLGELRGISFKSTEKADDGMIYPVISNTNYLDSHNDVHLNGSMSKTAKEQNGKVYYVADHKLEVDSIIATPKNVNIKLESVKFGEIGLESDKNTECLVFEINREDILHEKALKLIDNKEPLQNSIRMQYVKLDLAVNDSSDGYEDEFKVWSEVYPKLANPEKADELGYFWAVRELKIVNEGSMVLFGSNDMTPIKDSSDADESHHDKNEPDDSTQSVTDMLQKVKFNFK